MGEWERPMDLKEIREQKTEALVERLSEIAEQVFRIRCVAERLPPQKGAEMTLLRREAARVRTILRQRELNVEAKAALDALKKTGDMRNGATRAKAAKLGRQVRETSTKK